MSNTIGYTTGVFDMFHIGHLNILRQAKEQCDYLIVGVSTDECAMSYKNKKPIIPYEERATIVAAIKYVDQVVPQINMDKLSAWEQLHYDVLFHGDDWKNSAMYEKYTKELSKVGAKIVFLKHTQGISSTKLTNDLYSLIKKDNYNEEG